MTQFSENNAVKVGGADSPAVTKIAGEAINELTVPESLSLIVKKLNQITMILCVGLNVNPSDYELSDDPNSTIS